MRYPKDYSGGLDPTGDNLRNYIVVEVDSVTGALGHPYTGTREERALIAVELRKAGADDWVLDAIDGHMSFTPNGLRVYGPYIFREIEATKPQKPPSAKSPQQTATNRRQTPKPLIRRPD